MRRLTLHTSYWANFGGGYKNQNSFIEYSKNFIDRLNAWHSREKQRLRVDDFTSWPSSVYSMHYYDSVLVIEKRKIEKPFTRKTGNRSFAFGNQEVAEEAIASYRKEIELNPNNYVAYKNLGDALSDQGQQSEAIALEEQRKKEAEKSKIPVNKKGAGRSKKLSAEVEIYLTLFYLRHMPSFEVLAIDSYTNFRTSLKSKAKKPELMLMEVITS